MLQIETSHKITIEYQQLKFDDMPLNLQWPWIPKQSKSCMLQWWRLYLNSLILDFNNH